MGLLYPSKHPCFKFIGNTSILQMRRCGYSNVTDLSSADVKINYIWSQENWIWHLLICDLQQVM